MPYFLLEIWILVALSREKIFNVVDLVYSAS